LERSIEELGRYQRPELFPRRQTAAVRVEDHPWDYRDFEGTIPKGQYGGGTVMVWDQGTWTPHGDVDQGLKDGHLKFELHGKKLKGDWVLVRMHGGAGRWGKETLGKENWLLIKEKDKFARGSSDDPITEEAPDSVASGRTMEEIAARKGRVWNSPNGKSNGISTGKAKPTRKAAAGGDEAVAAVAEGRAARTKRAPDIGHAPKERFPGFISPQLALQTSSAPEGDDWVHELKLDGYRIQIQIRSGERSNAKGRANSHTVGLLTRKGLDWAARMPDIAAAAATLPVKDAILDGEAVALDERGVSSFADLQAAFQEGRERYITYFAFDLLHLNGHNLRGLPLSERKQILSDLLANDDQNSPLRLSEDLKAGGDEVFKKACALGAEGIVSKLASAKYTSGRSDSPYHRREQRELARCCWVTTKMGSFATLAGPARDSRRPRTNCYAPNSSGWRGKTRRLPMCRRKCEEVRTG
jgi:bifunctional non-homologous end joining protein LigD